MVLAELLEKYESNTALQTFLPTLSKTNYIDISMNANKYIITSNEVFNSFMKTNNTTIILDNNFELINSSCRCLKFFKENECVHTVALYAAAVYCINTQLYNKIIDDYKNIKLYKEHNDVLKGLANKLKSHNPYIGLIHLAPVIEVYDDYIDLSLKIGFDKEYVIKDIPEFINLTETDGFYSYGQKLEFNHSYECFDETSKIFYTIIRNICHETVAKSIHITKSNLLTILELYKDQTIMYKSKPDFKALPRTICQTQDAYIKLDDKCLMIVPPVNSRVLLRSIDHAYFISNTEILMYTYKNNIERKIYEYLYKVDGSLHIGVDSKQFISELLPVVRNNIIVDESFYEKYPIPMIKINSYISNSNDTFILTPKLSCRDSDRNSPYIKELTDGFIKLISSYGFKKVEAKKYGMNKIEDKYMFLTSDLSAIKAYGEVFFDESIKHIKPKKSSRTKINISYNVGLLDFNFENTDMTIEELQAMLIAYHNKEKFVRLKDDSILEVDQQVAKEMSDFLEDFNISVKDLSKPVTKPMSYILKLVSGIDTNVGYDDKIVQIISDIQNYKKSKISPIESHNNILRSYQKDGFKWLSTLSKYGFGGILADDMGLGKTIEVISFIANDKSDKPSLIVCPMSLLYNWENECLKWNAYCDVKLIVGSQEEREAIITSIKNNQKTLYITSYDSLRRDVSLYNAKFRFVIADEAQFIKNQFTQKSEAIKSLTSELNFALTGTPIENGLADLWSIFDFIMPGYLCNYSHFKSRYESLIMFDDEQALDNLKKRVSPFILRRTKKDVLKDLPEKLEEYYYYKMSDKQKDIYDGYVLRIKDDLEQGGKNVLALLTRLRQICITPELLFQESFDETKIDLALDIIKSSIDANHRILLFSQFSQSFPIISKLLEQMNIKFFTLDGKTKAKDRMDMVEEFNKNTDIKVFLISLKAGGTGLNLVGADTVIHLDPWWNIAAENQATDRAYRMGQTKDVTVIKLVCKDTIEEKVISLQNVKKELANSIISEDVNGQFKLTREDILELLD